MGCPNADCKKKVEEETTGQYRCDKCCQVFDTFKPTYIFSAPIFDTTGVLYVTFSGEMGDAVIGMSA